MVEFLNFSKQYSEIAEEVEAKVLKVLRSSKYILSEEVECFEQNLAEYCGTQYAVSVANGTDALVIAMRAAGIGDGDEVITTPFTFFATAEAVSNLNAKPVFVDIDEKSFCIDPFKIEEKINVKTKAVLPVHVFGQAANMDEIIHIASKYNLKIIEDACQSIGSEYRGKKACSFGDMGCLSFYPTKNLSCAGDGGAILTSNEAYYEKAKLLRNHGSRTRYVNDMLGYNSRLDEIQAGILNVKLKHIDYWNQKRLSLAERYDKYLGDIKGLQVPFKDSDIKHVYHLYSIRVQDRLSFKDFLDIKGIGNGIYYPMALYKQKPYCHLYDPKDFPVTERITNEIISLPLYPELSIAQQDEVIHSIIDFFRKKI